MWLLISLDGIVPEWYWSNSTLTFYCIKTLCKHKNSATVCRIFDQIHLSDSFVPIFNPFMKKVKMWNEFENKIKCYLPRILVWVSKYSCIKKKDLLELVWIECINLTPYASFTSNRLMNEVNWVKNPYLRLL